MIIFEHSGVQIKSGLNFLVFKKFVFNNFDYEGYGKDLLYSYNVVTLDNHNVVIFNQG